MEDGTLVNSSSVSSLLSPDGRLLYVVSEWNTKEPQYTCLHGFVQDRASHKSCISLRPWYLFDCCDPPQVCSTDRSVRKESTATSCTCTVTLETSSGRRTGTCTCPPTGEEGVPGLSLGAGSLRGVTAPRGPRGHRADGGRGAGGVGAGRAE